MNTHARHTAILAHARKTGKAPATPLAASLGVAVQTIRRDLRELCKSGLLERVHGGAVLPSGVRNIGYDDRRSLNRDAKQRIARKAASLIPDRATLFLNIGTTTEAVARALSDHRELLVVTNNMNVANILANHQSCEVVVAGGHLRRTDGGLVGDLAALAIARFKVDYAIIGASAIDPDGDLLDFDPEEVRVSRQIIDAARASMVVADASKLTRKAPVRIASLSEITHLVTDGVPMERMVNRLSDWRTNLHVA
ncbi:transcriptional regulator, DeoR family [Cognatiyoonia koreensis]|uniref:Transcriptional regulator, DeoR family n=1 Tax=Cognatiyoonia koreensis TaxID=364200 RepID=A0A1I0PEV8_9RHOB|nr:DeoR/GlpR family DNA-binding transcription regulator [Cognatiyoonia koreensis]SEW12978.1 transcriptional regulator, DeoR family [Cognatiyoonia koreensis]